MNKLAQLHLIQNCVWRPVFTLVGAWLVYQSQNTEMIARQESNVMFQKAMATTLFIFILGKFEHVDDW